MTDKVVRIDKELYEEARARYIDHAYLKAKDNLNWSPMTDKKIVEELIRYGLRVLAQQTHQNVETILKKGVSA